MDTVILQKRLRYLEDALEKQDLYAFLFVDREAINPSHIARDIVGTGFVGLSAFLITQDGKRKAIVRGYDADNIPKVYEVTEYETGFNKILLQELEKMKGKKLALNYSPNLAGVDTLSHGTYLIIEEVLNKIPGLKTVSAEDVLISSVGRRFPEEIELFKKAVEITDEILDETHHKYLKPSFTEIQVAKYMKCRMKSHEVEPAFDPDGCPIVATGKNTLNGHHKPAHVHINRGDLVNIDFGVKYEGFCSDLTWTWYVPNEGEDEPPRRIEKMFNVLRIAADAAIAAMKPGAISHEIDSIPRKVISDAGFQGYPYGTGHTIGRTAHGIGPGLYPLNDTYKNQGLRVLEEGNVITVEPAIFDSEIGRVAVEDDVLVTRNGAVVLNKKQPVLFEIHG
jgi:Xaa-Pro aminopeptidase